MKRHGSTIIIVSLILGAAVAPAAAQSGPAAPAAQQRQSRYQIAVMERVLEGAVEHGATVTRDRLQAVAPAQMLLMDNARVRGFRLDEYGVFFDVEVPSLDATFSSLSWSLRTLDQNNLGLQSAMNVLRTHIDRAGDADLQQAFKRIELQVAPLPVASTGIQVPPLAPAPPAAPAPAAARAVRNASQSTSALGAPQQPAQAEPIQPIDVLLSDPDPQRFITTMNDAYRGEVMQALMDAMLDYGGPLAIAPGEYLTIAARRSEERPRLAPADSDARTIVIRARGADLSAFRAGQISRDEAAKRVDRRVF
jgi:hypothetical protein